MHARVAGAILAGVTALVAGCNGGSNGGGQGGPVDPVTPDPPVTPEPALTFVPVMQGLPEDGMWKCDPIFADFNKDGFTDLAAIPRLGDGPRVWLGNGAGVWTESSHGLIGGTSCGGGLDIGDVNEDGNIDLVVADHCKGLFVYLGNGGGYWLKVTESLFPGSDVSDDVVVDKDVNTALGAEDVAVGDFDGDGHLDMVSVSSDEGGVNVYLGDGTGRIWEHRSTGLPTTGWGNRVAVADFDGNGTLDIAATYDLGPRVWINDGDAGFSGYIDGLPSPSMRGLFHGLAIGDVNGDGRLDLVVGNWIDGPEVYLHEENATWRKTVDVFPDMTGGAVGIALGNFNGDEYPDIVVAGRLEVDSGYVRGIFLLCGDGRGRFIYVENSGLPTTGLGGVAGVTAGDIDGDGIDDVALGTGLIVETSPGPTEPVIGCRLPVWTTRLSPTPSTPPTEARAHGEE